MNFFYQYFISKNKIEVSADIDLLQILEKIKKKYKKYPVNTADGVRIDIDKGWIHLRKSNTEPIIRIYAESDSMATANSLAKKMVLDIKELLSNDSED